MCAMAGMGGRLQAAVLPGVILCLGGRSVAVVGTRGRAFEDIGFEVMNLDAFWK